MEPLFTTSTKITLSEYRRFSFAIQLKIQHALAWLMLPVAAAVILAVLTREAYPLIFFLFPLLFAVLMEGQIRKTYKSNKILGEANDEISFYSNRVDVKNSFGASSYPYKKFFRIIEKRTNIYMMLAKNAGIILIKDNCTPETVEFVRNLNKNLTKKKK